MANFNEHALEMSIMELFQDAEYIYVNIYTRDRKFSAFAVYG